ncbi:PIG-L family deacetylase [Candidatus Poribacteria bacterium]|nr:PIG-L family deacetylase [Candidatus Poribacteria bacterium]MBT5537222.1 PIG-L family deacetylase [Candidatus Poribacteria bacterium]MBT5712414.1 PIG-L family deacetylase [Candidatus Poribacteria bacterium]MBT7096225.1 PIG-L family deacetylase [Candidatus Poribacteria bacterium]MBT7808955.1 PIG-L family deacetylase [Candidatus Poribacteria bacterium]
MAHPDDMELMCGGTMARLADAGWSIHVATATSGDCGTMTESPWAIGHRRTEEAAAAADLLGGTYHCLDERDCLVVYDKPTIRKAVDVFRVVAPSLVFTHAPRDYMVDHEVASLLARNASFIYGAPNISTRPRHDASTVPHLYYCDPMEGVDPLGREVEPTTVIDVTGHMDRKAEMLACHGSQREWLRAHHGMDEYIDAMQRHAAFRGEQVGRDFAEAFVQHRGHAYPRNDVLAEFCSNALA